MISRRYTAAGHACAEGNAILGRVVHSPLTCIPGVAAPGIVAVDGNSVPVLARATPGDLRPLMTDSQGRRKLRHGQNRPGADDVVPAFRAYLASDDGCLHQQIAARRLCTKGSIASLKALKPDDDRMLLL